MMISRFQLQKYSRGFTLIELLVVLMVMSLVLSLVGPAIQKIYAQHMAQQEMRLLAQYVRNASSFAFAQNQTVVISARANRITARASIVDFGVERMMSSTQQTTQNQPSQFDTLSVTDPTSLSLSADDSFNLEQDVADGDVNMESDHDTLFEHQFDYLTLAPRVFEALPSGYITLDSLQVSIGSGAVTKDVALKGLRFTQWFTE